MKSLAKHLPKSLYEKARRAEEFGRAFVTADGAGTLFEELGFFYVGPIDGHNLDHLLPVLKNVRDMGKGPVLVHVVTQKGKGYAPAEAAADKYHGVNTFDVVTGAQVKPKANAPAYQRVFADYLIKAAQEIPKIVAITAAMPSGTGLDVFGKAFPDRTFDVGIAEQHAVTFAAGLATEGYKPFCAIYSTFLQRGYDQLVHDVAIQNLPVRFAMDRAGLVGADGATHAGAFDLAYLCCLPNMTVMAAADEAELAHMVATAVAHDSGPIAFRYPRGEGVGIEMPERGEVLEIGKGRVVREGINRRDPVARHASRQRARGGRDARPEGHFDHRRRCALRQADRRRTRAQARPQARSADHHRGRLDRRLRRDGACTSSPTMACSTAA